jgi:hypothetical protein
MGASWTKQELQMAKAVRDSGKPLKTQLHLFPGRTQYGIEHKMRKLVEQDGPKKRETVSWVWGAAHSLLETAPGMTAHEIARKLKCSYRQAMQVLYDNHRGDDKCIYISGWEKHGVNRVPQWTIGTEPDAPKLPVQSREDELRKARLRHRKSRVARGAFNPFAAALGLVAAPKGEPGRVYIHLTDSKDDEYAEAA